MSRQSALAFLVSVTASTLIWTLSPLLTGHAECQPHSMFKEGRYEFNGSKYEEV